MRISGREIADRMYVSLQDRVWRLKQHGVTPYLVDILIGNDPGSEAYVRQKKSQAEAIGARATIIQYPSITTDELKKKLAELNADDSVHGIIVQRPLPPYIDSKQIDVAIDPMKDIDGFHPHSPFTLPLPLAVMRILQDMYIKENPGIPFSQWLQSLQIVTIGKGQTGGGPIIEYLKQLGIFPRVIDSQTLTPFEIIKTADVIISAVGKPNIITKEMIKPGVFLIGVGLHTEQDGRLHGDYTALDIESIAKYYTPTPGGVGPVNVACLMENLVTATENQAART